MTNSSKENVGEISFSNIIERKIYFHKNNTIFPREENENYFLGELAALEYMLKDSKSLTASQFEQKYLAELESLKKKFTGKKYIPDEDDYYEAYNNAVVGILSLLNPIHGYDIESNQNS